jgi:RimJ/RimL family protein N-acetyltransferase
MPDFLLPIEGEKVLIRKSYKKDLELLYALDVDEDVKRYVGGPVTRPRQEWIEGMQRLFAQPPTAALPLVVISKATGGFAGRASLSPKDTTGQYWEIQVLIARKYWGQRLGREVVILLMGVAFDACKASTVIAVVDPNNTASRALVDALGFRYVETKQSGRWDNGHLVFHRERGAL